MTHAALSTHDPANGRGTDFVAVDGDAEQFNGQKLMVISYVVIWATLLAWIYLLWRKQSELHKRIDDLEAAIDRTAKASSVPRGARAAESGGP